MGTRRGFAQSRDGLAGMVNLALIILHCVKEEVQEGSGPANIWNIQKIQQTPLRPPNRTGVKRGDRDSPVSITHWSHF